MVVFLFRKFWKKFLKFAFPIIRKVMPKLVAYDLVSVQPMSLPSGMIFHLDHVNSGSSP